MPFSPLRPGTHKGTASPPDHALFVSRCLVSSSIDESVYDEEIVFLQEEVLVLESMSINPHFNVSSPSE